LLDTADIVVRADLAQRCRNPRCENYALSPGCPPHVGGPAAMRKELRRHRQALFFALDLPTQALLTRSRREGFRRLHEMAADIERQALAAGYDQARAYVGGACKAIFCQEQADCRVLEGTGACRYPEKARASMSGYGIDVGRLIDLAGWGRCEGALNSAATPAAMTSLYGLVLLA
jgi:predicted metal-binding protein